MVVDHEMVYGDLRWVIWVNEKQTELVTVKLVNGDYGPLIGFPVAWDGSANTVYVGPFKFEWDRGVAAHRFSCVKDAGTIHNQDDKNFYLEISRTVLSVEVVDLPDWVDRASLLGRKVWMWGDEIWSDNKLIFKRTSEHSWSVSNAGLSMIKEWMKDRKQKLHEQVSELRQQIDDLQDTMSVIVEGITRATRDGL